MSRATNQISDKLAEEATENEDYKYKIKQMTNTAWDILELEMCNPGIRQIEIAEKLGISRPYISRVVNSPCYQLEMRRMRNQRIFAKLHDAGEAGVDRLKRIVEDEDSADSDAIEASKVTLEALGFRGSQKGGVNVFLPGSGEGGEGLGVTADMVNEARQRREEKVINGKAVEVKDVEEE